MDVGLAKKTDPNAPLPSNGPLSRNLASTTPPRTNKRSAKRKGRKEKKKKRKRKKESSGTFWSLEEWQGKKRRKEG